jgi:hypothetical protein
MPPPAPGPQTVHYSAPPARPQLEPGTSTSTPWIWIIVLLPMIGLGSVWLMDPIRFMPAPGDLDSTQFMPFQVWADPMMLLIMGLSYLTSAVTIVAAFLDFRALQRIGVIRPFHWAWAFTTLAVGSLVYVIGRTVIVGKVTPGRGSAPLWVAIAITVLGMINVGIWTFWFMGRILDWAFTVGAV